MIRIIPRLDQDWEGNMEQTFSEKVMEILKSEIKIETWPSGDYNLDDESISDAHKSIMDAIKKIDLGERIMLRQVPESEFVKGWNAYRNEMVRRIGGCDE